MTLNISEMVREMSWHWRCVIYTVVQKTGPLLHFMHISIAQLHRAINNEEWGVIWLAVTSWYHVETNERTIMQFSLSESNTVTVVFKNKFCTVHWKLVITWSWGSNDQSAL